MAKPGRKNFISILIILLIYFTLLFLFATVRFLKTPLEKIPEVPTIETIVAEPVVEPPIIEVEQVPFVEEPLIEIEEPLIEVQEPIVEIEEPVVEILEPIIEIEEPIVDIEEIVFEPPFLKNQSILKLMSTIHGLTFMLLVKKITQYSQKENIWFRCLSTVNT